MFRPGVFSLMVLIAGNPGVSQTEIALQLGFANYTISTMVRRLERERWVDRRPASGNKRRQDVFLTADGQRA